MSLPGPNILLLGDSGTGKTHALRTFLDVGITPFILFTEPGMEVLGDIPEDKCHWHYCPPGRQDWSTMLTSQTAINTLTMDQLAKMPDMSKAKYRQFLELLTQFQNFKCHRTGEEFGDVTEWNTDRALILDSMSGLNILAMDHVVGGKPVKSIQNWGVAMDGIEKLINKLTLDTYCPFVLTAHLERETDEITGGQQLMAATLGRRLAPRIPRFFSDVIQTVRIGKEFSWTTVTANVTTKARNVPWDSGLPPSFTPLIEQWKSKGGRIHPTSSPPEPKQAQPSQPLRSS
jgi:hypothetical protein